MTADTATEHARPDPVGNGDPGRHLVVGVDGSAPSIAALHTAAELARRLGRPLTAVAAWSYPSFLYGGYYPEVDWRPEEDAARMLARASEEVFGRTPPAWFSTRAVQGRPAPTLIDQSGDAEMLVVGSRGHGGFVGLLLGSVSAAVAEHAKCPVLVVHGR